MPEPKATVNQLNAIQNMLTKLDRLAPEKARAFRAEISRLGESWSLTVSQASDLITRISEAIEAES